MTLQEKIIELLPKEKDEWNIQDEFIESNARYNQALQDVKEKLPEILKLIRERIAGLPPYFHQDIKE